ncbi:PREDICTED: hippocampus abundant transcript-like protein 1 [Amphimedon queenslandica]|uniref:Major facilitator superfamily (MFS) profile domain-containing protein n=1 Tax=Amphimedon queenslandica TaxID=400682 RepID=A0A1X7VGZ9_AMPQE|nr:PREDICTED: hippocampus abundant transcript-like protein 1 [Amphimedon queenslandica]|eukprot:XP_019849085.1 PREDICTED: hippocampus abundant transcript-like protein 1 [Amphimedon queenslandica]
MKRSSSPVSLSSSRTSLSSVESRSGSWVKYLPPDASSPQCVPNLSWSCLRNFLFPVEALFLLGMFVYFYFSISYRQYIFQHIARDSTDRINETETSICLNQTYITDLTNSTTFVAIQSHVNLISMETEIIYLVLSGIVSLLLGSVSDVVGRKPVFVIVFAGMILTSISQIFIVYFDAPPRLYLIPAFLFGISGGHAALIGLVFASVSDMTASKKWLTFRMGIVEAALTLAQGTSAPALNEWIQNSGCNFRPTVWLMLSITVLAMFFLIPFPESKAKDPADKDHSNWDRFSRIFSGFKVFLQPSSIGYSKWWRLCCVLCVVVLEIITLIGLDQVLEYFLHNEPLQWGYTRIGYYKAIAAFSRGACLLFLLPILIILKFSNLVICLIACVFAVVTSCMIATVRANWEMYVAGVFGGVSFITFPAIRSILTELVPSQNLGAVFSITASLQTLISIGSTVLYNEVYHPQANIKGHTYHAGTMFWIAAGFWGATIPILLLLLLCRPRKSLRNAEKRGLLEESERTSDYSSLAYSVNNG